MQAQDAVNVGMIMVYNQLIFGGHRTVFKWVYAHQTFPDVFYAIISVNGNRFRFSIKMLCNRVH